MGHCTNAGDGRSVELDRPELAVAWQAVGVPPGPWTDRFGADKD